MMPLRQLCSVRNPGKSSTICQMLRYEGACCQYYFNTCSSDINVFVISRVCNIHTFQAIKANDIPMGQKETLY
jgi:hypothetical protein